MPAKITPAQERALAKMPIGEWLEAKDIGERETTMWSLYKKKAIKLGGIRNSDGVNFYVRRE